MNCAHEFWESESAVAVDGLCPLCLHAENAKMRAALKSCDYAFFTIVANTEPDAIKHASYDDLAKDICAAAAAQLPVIRDAIGIPPKGHAWHEPDAV